MIVQKEFLSKLKDFGLNTYESKLWTALLSRGVSTAGELSDIANVKTVQFPGLVISPYVSKT